MKESTFKLPESYSFKSIWRITFPILVALVMEELLGMTDTAFLGRVGEIELGASAIAGVYFTILYMLGFGFSIGVQIIIGRRNGRLARAEQVSAPSDVCSGRAYGFLRPWRC